VNPSARYDTHQLRALDARHHLHPFTVFKELAQKGARIITRARGCWIEDSEGRRYLDGMAGLWCVNLGYGEPRLIEAARAQLEELPYYNTFFQCATPPAVELAAAISGLLPQGFDSVFFASSGSEANDTAIKAIWYYWNLAGRPEKKLIISRRRAYHGVGLGSGSLSGLAPMHAPFDLPLARFHHIEDPYWYREGRHLSPEAFGREAARRLEEAILRLGPEKVAAFFGEPVQGAGGVIVPPPGYWPEVERICRRYDVLLVSDEVICGLGRTGRRWGFETCGFTPDIVTMAKGLTSGYQPLAAVAFGPRVAAALLESDLEFAHGGTWAGHPVACRVALETLAVMEERRLFTRAGSSPGKRFARRLHQLAQHPLVGEVRVLGMLAAIELVADKRHGTPFAPEHKAGIRCRELALAHGLVMRAIGDVMVLAPPLVLAEEEIDELARRAEATLDALAHVLRQDGVWP